MKVTLRDTDALLAIPPLEAAAYLRAHGWREFHRVPDVMSTWVVAEDPNTGPEVLLPLSRHFRDYTLRMSELLTVLERYENRSQLDILKDILNTTGDVVRVRLARADITDGSVPLDVGVQLVQGVRDIVAAAALATVSPKPYYVARPPGEVASYLQKVRMGQTENGSYVVTVVSRVTPNLQLGIEGPPVDPFERKVVLTIASSLDAVKNAADLSAAQGSAVPFEEAVPNGVSANLCDAVVNIGGDDPSTIIDVSFAWSAARPVSRDVITQVILPHDRLPYIKEGGRALRATAPMEDVDLRGAVTRLDRSARSGPGVISVYAIVDRQARHVRISLPERDYELAAQAHVDGRSVVCQGNLVREGKSYLLQNPHGFAIDTLAEE